MKAPTLRAVLFDFDGTLWDSESAVFEVMRDLYREHGQELTLETWSGAVGTVGGFEPYATLHRLVGPGMDVDAVRDSTEARILEAAREVPMRPGVEVFLRQVDEAGVARALVSSDRSEWLVTNLERLGWSHGWAAMVCAEGIAEHAKPDPHLYLAALEILDVPPTSALAVEDSPNGIRAAKAAGVPCLCVPNAITETLDLSGADALSSSFDGLDLLGVWSAVNAEKGR